MPPDDHCGQIDLVRDTMSLADSRPQDGRLPSPPTSSSELYTELDVFTTDRQTGHSLTQQMRINKLAM